MKVGDLVVLKHSPQPVVGVVIKLGDEDGFEDWAAIQFVNEAGPGWFKNRHLKLWSEDENR